MSTPKITRAVQNLFKQVSRMAQSLTKGLVRWLLRGLLVIGRQPLASKVGFVLPTTVLLLLVVTLTVGAIGYRTYTRSQQAIGERQQRVIYNAASPAIDRAKAKLEFMFNPQRERRFGGVPGEDQLMGIMLNDGSGNAPQADIDPYTFAPEEQRIDLNQDGTLDNAWFYLADRDGDGTNDSRVVYSIIFSTPSGGPQDPLRLRDSTDATLAQRARQLLVRNAPLSSPVQGGDCARVQQGGAVGPSINEIGWFRDDNNPGRILKNFQVNAYVLPLTNDGTADPNSTVAALEFQQDREAAQGFRWAAWFRNDLEIFPGPQFNWNGAMHTEGSYFVTGNFRAFMVSSHRSCLYEKNASRLTAPDVVNNPDRTIPDFQGQFVTGSLRDNNFGGNPKFDLWNGRDREPRREQEMDSRADSLNDIGQGPIAIALDPVILQTQDISVGRIIGDPRTQRAGAWAGGIFANADDGRMDNDRTPTPYLDDTFRADYRYGPNPRFGFDREPIPNQIGSDIPQDNLQLRGDDAQIIGLDGYWEQRARVEGVRVIVGQRLELGDPAGWGGPASNGEESVTQVRDRIIEPLRPWTGNCSGNRCNEMRQRRTLWDNLAAVQSTAIYHSAGQRDFPTACLVSTVHPGTAGTLDKSATFENLAYGIESGFGAPYNASGSVISDFFRGRGTNGWEYSLPSAGDFSNLNSPLMRGLRNLAYFAGDPRGGAPSFTPIQDGNVHPYPVMSMWGDFSMLRRVIAEMESGTSYDRLSPADKTTLHTAACTLGMLAYNIDYLNNFDVTNVPASVLGNTTGWDGLRGHIRAIDALIADIRTGAAETGTPAVPLALRNSIPAAIKLLQPEDILEMVGTPTPAAASEFSNNPEVYVRLLELWRDSDALRRDELTREINLAQMLITQQQVLRDREYGFQGAYAIDGNNRNYLLGALSPSCQAYISAADPLGRLCSDRPRYPILYSLFPLQAHGDVFDASASNPIEVRARVRDGEDGQDRSFAYLRNVNQGIRYTVLTPAQINQIALRPSRLASLGFSPNWRLPTATATAGATPNSGSQDLIKVCAPNNLPCSLPQSATNRLPVSGTRYRVPFKDAAFMNGRELMSVRTLDLDLDLLRQSAFGNDFWLPRSGIIYAFREDAVSEAHIVRPATAAWTSCNTEVALRTVGNCQMATSTSAIESTDPPLSPSAITTKPVDYFPDPDRRPHGFRLRNGASLWRGTSGGGDINDAADPPGRGLSFITHNPAYVQGYFNLHRSPGSNSLARNQGLEEFNERVQTSEIINNFYTRGNSGLNNDFAAIAQDQWRPSEIIADAVTPLSNSFCDGSIEDGFITAAPVNNNALTSAFVRDRYGCPNSGAITSYFNFNRPNVDISANTHNGVKWVRSNIADSLWRAKIPSAPDGRGESPIFIINTGEPLGFNPSKQFKQYESFGTEPAASTQYVAMNLPTPGQAGRAEKPLPVADDGIQMNMIAVSGIVPSRQGQSYGGLHNFPRFIEDWDTKQFYISGAFLQLNFSSYATAPFDQEQWQPGLPAPATGSGNNEWIRYYRPPNRRWGFDVAMLYAAPGPVAQRFRTTDPARSEFYSEPPADDPYIRLLADCADDPAACRANPNPT